MVNDVVIETRLAKDHAVVFENVVLKDGENKLEVRSGGYMDAIVVYRTKENHPEYKVQKADTKNWM